MYAAHVMDTEPKTARTCSRCGGTGTIKTTDWVDYGSTVVPMESSEYCDCYIGTGKWRADDFARKVRYGMSVDEATAEVDYCIEGFEDDPLPTQTTPGWYW